MKGGAKTEAQGPMSGKDKAKLLKMMKEQSKQQQQQARPVPVPKPKAAALSTQGNAQSGLPSDFFDSAPSAPAVLPTVVARPSQSNAQSAATGASASNISNLPKGFFDNPVEDLNARGISMEQYTAKMEKDEQAELDSFLTQLKGIEGESERLEEAADQRDESIREYEEEAAQMAYLANLIALRAQSEKLTKSSATSNAADTLQEEGSEALDHLLKEVAEVRAATTSTNSAALDVDAILSQKLAQSAAQKRKRDAILKNIQSKTISKEADTSDNEGSGGSNSDDDSESGSESDSESNKKAKPVPKYTPLNFMNWTSRTY